jgi:urease accessory protein
MSNAISTHADPPPVHAGHGHLEVGLVFRESTVTSVSAGSPFKVLVPCSRGRSVWAYTSSFGGGLVAGDQTRLEVVIGAGARCLVSTQSSTKVYRNPARLPCSHATHAVLGAEALLVFLPEPVQAFAASNYTQQQEFHLEGGAGLVLLDWVSSGRTARGERWAFTHFETRNDVFFGKERVFVDPVLLSSNEVPLQMDRFNCLATLLLIGAPFQVASQAVLASISARPVARRASLAASASTIRDGAVLRVAGESVEAVRAELQKHLSFLEELLGDDPWTRKW